jgi:hypothetical protein
MISHQSDPTCPSRVLFTFDDGEFTGCQFYFRDMRMADEAYPDGSCDLLFNYTVTNDFEIRQDQEETFGRTLGQLLLDTLIAQTSHSKSTT